MSAMVIATVFISFSFDTFRYLLPFQSIELSREMIYVHTYLYFRRNFADSDTSFVINNKNIIRRYLRRIVS